MYVRVCVCESHCADSMNDERELCNLHKAVGWLKLIEFNYCSISHTLSFSPLSFAVGHGQILAVEF